MWHDWLSPSTRHKQDAFWSFGGSASMDGCLVCAQGTIPKDSPCTLQIHVQSGEQAEGRDSVLCHSPGTPEEIPFLQKLTQFTGLTGFLELEPVSTQGTLPGSWWQPVPWEAPKFHIPSFFRSSHSVPPSRQQT